MRTDNMKIETFTVRLPGGSHRLSFSAGGGFAAGWSRAWPDRALLRIYNQKTFSSPCGSQRRSLSGCTKGRWPALEAILGAGKEVTSSSDEAEDKLEREQFSQNTRRCTVWSKSSTEPRCCTSAPENWPFPIPLFSKNGACSSIPRPARRKCCSEELERMSPLRLSLRGICDHEEGPGRKAS